MFLFERPFPERRAAFLPLCVLAAALLLHAALPHAGRAQVPYDASWYDGRQPYAKIAVTEDGLHRISGARLRAAGVPLGQIDPSTLRLLEKGREIPLDVQDENGDGALSPGDGLLFVGRRNRGTDEAWAYNYAPSRQSSTYRSLYTDTLTYWLTWGGQASAGAGWRYAPAGSGGSGTVIRTARDTLHREQDRAYHFGPSHETGNPLFVLGEGYYWHRMGGSGAQTYTLSLPRAAPASEEDLRLTAKLAGRTGSCHRAVLEADFGSGFETVGEVQWQRYDLATLEARVPQERLSRSSIELRVRTFNSGFDGASCDASTPNGIFVDYVEAAYTRRLTPAADGQQRFAAPSASPTTFELSGYASGERVDVFSPATGRRFTLRTGAGGTARFFDDPPSSGTGYWAAAAGRYLAPAALAYHPAASQPDWTAPANSADYVVLTTEAMRATAEELAAYRRSHDGYTTAVVTVREVFDQFDYGRATPIAIRRFVHYTQRTWDGPPRFLTLWGDATYPIRTATEQPGAPWNVPAFGFAPSDAWYAMQYEGPDDWSEVVALGRVPVRTAAQARTFLEKLKGYEAARLGDWQKRYLALSGGSSPAQQRRLGAYNTGWAETAARPPTGMDTLYFSKHSSDALDASFQDSLSAAFERGAGWLNYFGHSAAQTWEIVTEAPAQFENAGRLPFVVSLGCQTGAFAGGRFSEKPAPSFGEQLVLGLHPDAPLGPGSRSGAIAHFGTSYQGTIGASAVLNEQLIGRVFKDTMRLAGTAVQQAKARVAEGGAFGAVRDHLLQYNLLGEPATRLAIPARPNLHLEASQISTRPLAPVPSDSLRLAVRLRNQGLVPGRVVRRPGRTDSTQVPADSVISLTLTQHAPDGTQVRQQRRFRAFPVDTTLTFSFYLTEDMVGRNTFRAAADIADHPLARVPEVREDDNSTEKTQIVSASGVRLVAPRNLGVALAANPVFRLSLSSASEEAQPVRLQLAADSAFANRLAEDVREATGPLVKWAPPVALEAGRTYYWRARLDAPGGQGGWRTASFTARPNIEGGGWLQQGAQFSENDLYARLVRSDGRWRFGTSEVEVLASSERGSGAFKGQFNIGGSQRYENLGLGIGVLIMDGSTGRIKASGSYCTYQTSYENNEDACTGGVDGEAAVARLDSLLRTTLDEGDYLFTRTRNLGRRSAPFPESLDPIFQHLGEDSGPLYSQAIDTLAGSDLWIMHARKGFPGQTYEQVEPSGSGENEIVYRTRLPFSHPEGQTSTPRIGPAQRWDGLAWEATFDDAGDRLRIDVLSEDGQTVLIGDLNGSDQTHDLSGLSAAEHPYLRLRAHLTDSTGRTAPQLERWHLAFTPTAELAFDAARLQTTADTLEEGQQMALTVPVVNLTDVPSSPVRVHFAVTDSANQTRTVATDTLGALAPDAEAAARARFSTDEMAGANVLTVRAEQVREEGPEGAPVPEVLAFNNTLVSRFYVRTDRTPPSVRVSVGGRSLPHDPEPLVNLQDPSLPFVALNPTFAIILEDDNEYLALTDTSLIEVRLDGERIPFAGAALEFDPAEEAGDDARALFSPDFSGQDTVHTLQVEVRDARDNKPETAYQVHFRVKAEMKVRDLYPYPNPMSEHTNFAFRLEGGDPSDIEQLRLRIYTISGRLIREFRRTAADLTPDWNTIRWDGRDADGDRVATGVYLYNVHIDGEGDLNVNDGGVEKIAVIR